MNSGQKIGLTSSLIKQKIENAKLNQPQQPVLVVPTLDDKKRLRKKIEEYKRIQRREYPKKKVAHAEMEIKQEPPVEETVQQQQISKKEEKTQQPIPQVENSPRPQPIQTKQQKGRLESTLVQQYLDNEFYDQECEQADKELENIQGSDKKFKKKMRRVSSIMERLSKSVHELKNKYDQMDILQLLGRKRNKRRQAEALAFVKSQIQQKKEMNKKFDSIKDSEAKKKETEEQARKRQQEKEKQKKLKEIQKELDEKRKEKQRQKKRQKQRQQKAKAFLKNYLLQDPLYKVWQEKQEKKQNKQKEIQKAYLNKRRQKFKPLDEKQLTEHMKIHNEKLRDNQQVKQQQKIEKQQQIVQENLKLLEKIYRGKNYERVQQQIEQREKMKLRNKEKRERLKKYQEYVKQNFLPEMKQEEEEQEENQQAHEDGSNEDEEENENEEKSDRYPQFRKIKRYKFLQGKSCGEVIETVKMPLSEKLQRRIGDGYLQHVKSLPKKPKSKLDMNLSEEKQTEAPSTKSRVTVEIPKMPRPKHFKVDLSDNPNRKEIDNLLILLKSKDNLVEMKQKYLCKLSDRSHYENVQNQINSNIVQNIERKLSLLTKL